VGRPDKVESALLDASALIGVIKGEEAFAPLKSLLAAVDRGEVTLVESTAMLAEVQPTHAADTGAHALAREAVRALLESPDTQLVDVNTVVARKAGELRVKHGMTTWDAVHLATAVLAKVDVLVVRDGKFPMGRYEGIWVTGPFDMDDDKLPGLFTS
jgi:predicted nucleic acid-binding protein